MYVESNEQTDLTSKTETDSEIESRLTAIGGRSGGKANRKGLMDIDKSVVIAGAGCIRGLSGNGNIAIKTWKSHQISKGQRIF